MKIKEPVRQTPLTFALIPRSSLIPSVYQRDLSTGLSNKLVKTIASGFLVPLIVVESDIESGFYEIVDGQHRLDALDKVISNGDYDIPCIIAPLDTKYSPLRYNVEKADNIKDQCVKLHALYLSMKEMYPDTEEREFSMQFNQPHLTTMAFAHLESNVSSPSLVESPVKKLDHSFLSDPLSGAIEERKQRGGLVKKLEASVSDVANMYNIKDFNLKKSVISQSMKAIWGSKQKIDKPFSVGIGELIEQIMTSNWGWMSGR